MKRILLALIGMVLLLSLSACGGGGGSGTTATPTASSNWGQMQWDQNNWG